MDSEGNETWAQMREYEASLERDAEEERDAKEGHEDGQLQRAIENYYSRWTPIDSRRRRKEADTQDGGGRLMAHKKALQRLWDQYQDNYHEAKGAYEMLRNTPGLDDMSHSIMWLWLGRMGGWETALRLVGNEMRKMEGE